MRKLVLIVICAALIGCASSNNATLPQRIYCEDTFSKIWRGSQMAVNELGFSVINANDIGGSILGRMEADIYGSEMEINVSVTENKGGRTGPANEPIWVQVKVVDASNANPDEHRLQQMKMMEDQFMDLLRQMAACGATH